MEVLCEKLKTHHQTLGTFNTMEALAERKRVCSLLGLLRKEDHYLVTSVAEHLPVLARPSAERSKEEQQEREEQTSDEESMSITPAPSALQFGRTPPNMHHQETQAWSKQERNQDGEEHYHQIL